MQKLLIRNDDILVHSRQFAGREFDRFRGKHELICQSDKLLHVPAILVSEIQDFPQCIDYVKSETEAGRMQPELHGYKHIDYAKLSDSELNEHLTKSLEWFRSTLSITPTRWYTPFGAGADEFGYHLNVKAKEFNLTLYAVDTGTPYKDVKATVQISDAVRQLREGTTFKDLCSKYDDVLLHWWEAGSRLNRLVEISKYGTYQDAATFNRKLFT